MSGYFRRLADRALGRAPLLVPRQPSRFEDGAGWADPAMVPAAAAPRPPDAVAPGGAMPAWRWPPAVSPQRAEPQGGVLPGAGAPPGMAPSAMPSMAFGIRASAATPPAIAPLRVARRAAGPAQAPLSPSPGEAAAASAPRPAYQAMRDDPMVASGMPHGFAASPPDHPLGHRPAATTARAATASRLAPPSPLAGPLRPRQAPGDAVPAQPGSTRPAFPPGTPGGSRGSEPAPEAGTAMPADVAIDIGRVEIRFAAPPPAAPARSLGPPPLEALLARGRGR
jgi:hypothetical protein